MRLQPNRCTTIENFDRAKRLMGVLRDEANNGLPQALHYDGIERYLWGDIEAMDFILDMFKELYKLYNLLDFEINELDL